MTYIEHSLIRLEFVNKMILYLFDALFDERQTIAYTFRRT